MNKSDGEERSSIPPTTKSTGKEIIPITPGLRGTAQRMLLLNETERGKEVD